MRRRKTPMSPIEVGNKELECRNAAFWPPLEIEHLADSSEELRFRVPDVVYQRIKTWEQVCGLLQMNPDKCLTCPYVVIDGVAAQEPGTRNARTIVTKRRRLKSLQKKR